MIRIVTCNLNGIRSAASKGFFDWLKTQQADIICFQETKAQLAILAGGTFYPEGYHCFYHDAQKKGYSGVALYSKQVPKKVITGLGWDVADNEGRYVQADFDHINVASLYLPSGTMGEARQKIKFDFLARYMKRLQTILKQKRSFIICGDWNIAHKPIDLKNWRANQKNSGFLPEERAWLDQLFDELGFIDAFRALNQNPDQYTWWSHRGRAREKNVGWRIDYQVVTPNLKNKIKAVRIYNEKKFSDHAPLIVDYDITL